MRVKTLAMTIVAAAAVAWALPACSDGARDDVKVLTTALVTPPASGDAATVRIMGATDWEAAGREPLALHVHLDGEPAGWVIGEAALPAFEGSGIAFGAPEGTTAITLVTPAGEAVWDFGAQDLVAGRTTDLLYYGSPDDPRVMALPDLGADLPAGQSAARLVNLDDTRGPVSALLCPENGEDFDGCEVVAADLGYGEAWTGVVAAADGKVLRWERPAPEGFPNGRFIGGGGEAIGHSLCHGDGPLVRTFTLVPVHASTPAEAPECPYCTSGWMFGDGTSPGDCRW